MYKIDDDVEVFFESDGGEWLRGKIISVHKNYAWTRETKYSVHGHKERPFVTITSARNIRAAKTLTPNAELRREP